jgi:hypothetical protein
MLFALCPAADAQQLIKIPRLGALLYSTPETDPNFAAFRQGLRERGMLMDRISLSSIILQSASRSGFPTWPQSSYGRNRI